GVALAGSQALGLQRRQSDIDLLVITDPRYMWLARTLLTAYAQIAGVRRHGNLIADRVCLNHYVAGPHLITHIRNLYTASEYAKLRPIYNPEAVWQFQHENISWIAELFPNQKSILATKPDRSKGSKLQHWLEWLIHHSFGRVLEKALGDLQAQRIRIQKDIVV